MCTCLLGRGDGLAFLAAGSAFADLDREGRPPLPREDASDASDRAGDVEAAAVTLPRVTRLPEDSAGGPTLRLLRRGPGMMLFGECPNLTSSSPSEMQS